MMGAILVHPVGPRLDAALLERAKRIESSAISDARAGSGAVVGLSQIGGITAIPAGTSIAGPAFTVRVGANDNLGLHRALDDAQPGDVLVVHAPPDSIAAVMGDLMGRYAATRGIAAVVVDGVVRDQSDLASGPLPVYARGTCHVGPAKLGPGELHGPIRVGGAEVRDGDLVIADRDGVTIVPVADAADSVAAGEAVMAREAGTRRDIEAGTWDRAWVLAAAPTIIVDHRGEPG